jgi:hypothetical protein
MLRRQEALNAVCRIEGLQDGGAVAERAIVGLVGSVAVEVCAVAIQAFLQ